jgi:dTDP-4-amino-4,6-dideoxygalactose transaminase
MQRIAIRREFLPFSPPYITEEEIGAVVETLRTDWISTGPKVRQFEAAFAAYIGAAGALALNSCTGGLHVALAALGVGPGDEVITTPITFASTANVVEHRGGVPVLADVQADTLTIDPAEVEKRITPRTKALMPVHFAGHPCDMRPLRELAARHGLFIIEDAAHALPARYEGQMIGTLSDFTAFSFYATKNITTGEGGMLTANDHPQAAERLAEARMWSLHGMNRDAWKRYSAGGSWYYEVVLPGFKYNMTDIQAALGLVQLGRLAGFQARRREIVARYNAAFGAGAAQDALQTPTERPNAESAWHLYVLRLKLDALTIDRARFIDELKARNIGTSVHFIPLHLHPYYRDRYGWAPEAYPVAYGEYQRAVSLPLHPRLSDDDADDVIQAVLDVVAAYRR